MKKTKALKEGKVVNATFLTEKEFKNLVENHDLKDWGRKDFSEEALNQLNIAPPKGFLFAKASGGSLPLEKYPGEYIGIDLFREDPKTPGILKVYHSYGKKTSDGCLVFLDLNKNKDHHVKSFEEFEEIHDE